MDRTEFFNLAGAFFRDAYSLMQKKNKDYGREDSPFADFRACEAVGVSPERAVLVRLQDKLVRAANVIGRVRSVEDETLRDTCIDIANLAAILYALESDRTDADLDAEELGEIEAALAKAGRPPTDSETVADAVRSVLAPLTEGACAATPSLRSERAP